MSKKPSGPRVLLYDIETAPIIAHVWGLWEQNVGLSQIESDWHLLSFSAKWLGDPPSKIIYADQRGSKNIEDDKALLQKLWNLLDEADYVITQNGVAFDNKKVNARFLIHGFPPPSSFINIDTKQIASRKFGFTSNKLEYLTNKLNKKYKKLKHNKYAGHELWTECLAGNLDAWRHMEKYNKYDVLSLEELYLKLQPWDNKLNLNLFTDSEQPICTCGSTKFKANGYKYLSTGKYQRYVCSKCGKETRSKENLLTKEKRKSLRA